MHARSGQLRPRAGRRKLACVRRPAPVEDPPERARGAFAALLAAVVLAALAWLLRDADGNGAKLAVVPGRAERDALPEGANTQLPLPEAERSEEAGEAARDEGSRGFEWWPGDEASEAGTLEPTDAALLAFLDGPMREVVGEVVDDVGAPIAWATVSLELDLQSLPASLLGVTMTTTKAGAVDDDTLLRIRGGVFLRAGSLLRNERFTEQLHPTTSTDSDGCFNLHVLAAARYDAVAWDTENRRNSPRMAVGDAPLQLVIARPSALAGSVVLPDGLPASRLRVAATAEGEPVSRTTLAEDGSFGFEELPANRYCVTVELQIAGAFAPVVAIDSVVVRGSEECLDSRLVAIDITPFLRIAEVEVQSTAGEYIARGRYVLTLPPSSIGALPETWTTANALSAIVHAPVQGGTFAGNRFAVLLPIHGEYGLTVTAPGFRAARLHPLGTRERVRLEPALRVAFRLAPQLLGEDSSGPSQWMFLALGDDLEIEQRLLEPEPDANGSVDVDFPATGRWAARVILHGRSGAKWLELEPFELFDHHHGTTLELNVPPPEPPPRIEDGGDE